MNNERYAEFLGEGVVHSDASLFNLALARLGVTYRVESGEPIAAGLLEAFLAIAKRLEKLEAGK